MKSAEIRQKFLEFFASKGHQIVASSSLVPHEDPVSIQDFNATIAHACGLPLDHVLTSPSGRPFKVADKGSPVTSIFA